MDTYEVKVERPNRPEGEEITIPPFGTVVNGGTATFQLSDEDAAKFASTPGIKIRKSGEEYVPARIRTEPNEAEYEEGTVPPPEATATDVEETPSEEVQDETPEGGEQ